MTEFAFVFTSMVVLVIVALFVSRERTLRSSHRSVVSSMQEEIDSLSSKLAQSQKDTEGWYMLAATLLGRQPGAYINGTYAEHDGIRINDAMEAMYLVSISRGGVSETKWRKASPSRIADMLSQSLRTSQPSSSAVVSTSARMLRAHEVMRASQDNRIFSEQETNDLLLPPGWDYQWIAPDQYAVVRK